MGSLPQRFAIRRAHHIATIVGRGGVVAGSEIGRVLTRLVFYTIQMYLIIAYTLILAITSTALETQDNVASTWVQTTIKLEHGPGILVFSVCETGIDISVYQIWC